MTSNIPNPYEFRPSDDDLVSASKTKIDNRFRTSTVRVVGVLSSMYLSVVLLFLVASFWITDANWPTGVKLYASLLLCVFLYFVSHVAARYREPKPPSMGIVSLSFAQAIVVIAYSGIILVYFMWLVEG